MDPSIENFYRTTDLWLEAMESVRASYRELADTARNNPDADVSEYVADREGGNIMQVCTRVAKASEKMTEAAVELRRAFAFRQQADRNKTKGDTDA